MRLYHTTDSAEAILRDGFRDATGSYGFVDFTLTGVFFADLPVDCNEGAKGDQVIEVTLPDSVSLDDFELVYEDPRMRSFREWCVPASLINQHGSLRLIAEDELMTKLSVRAHIHLSPPSV